MNIESVLLETDATYPVHCKSRLTTREERKKGMGKKEREKRQGMTRKLGKMGVKDGRKRRGRKRNGRKNGEGKKEGEWDRERSKGEKRGPRD